MVDAAIHRSDHERSDVDPRLLVILGATLGAFLVAAPYVLFATYPAARRDALIRPTQRPPAPRLQVDPAADLRAMRRSEDALLSRYRWVDRGNGVVGLPIERAIELTFERGLSDWRKP
jgi:hypothetical protein